MASARKTLRSTPDLIAAGLIPAERRAGLEAVAARYAVAVTADLADLIDPADPADPIARQFVPDAAELRTDPHEVADPIGDDAHSPVEGIVHRYPDRVLLKLNHVCAVYCRFCFRREMVGPRGRGALAGAKLDAALAYIAAQPGIWEVILTGGDPLLLSPRRLKDVVSAARRDRARQDRARAHAPAGGGAGAGHVCAGTRAESARQGDLRGAARQSCARIVGARRGRPARASSMPAFPCSARACCCAA